MVSLILSSAVVVLESCGWFSAGIMIHCTSWQVKMKLILVELKSSPWLLDICFCLAVFSAWRLGWGFETWLRLWVEILVADFRKSHLFYSPLSCCIIRSWSRSSLLAQDIWGCFGHMDRVVCSMVELVMTRNQSDSYSNCILYVIQS